MRSHYWSYLLNNQGQPVVGATIDVYAYPLGGGTVGYANIFETETSAVTTTAATDFLTNSDGFFEFYIADLEEGGSNGYEYQRQFKIAWSGLGVTPGFVDKIQIFDVTKRAVDTSSAGTYYNRVISNVLAKGWEEHRTGSGDDHIIYLLADGTRELTGDWSAGTGNKILVDTLSPVDASALFYLKTYGGTTGLSMGLTGIIGIPTVDINGGNIDGTAIGFTTPFTGKFTTLEATSATLTTLLATRAGINSAAGAGTTYLRVGGDMHANTGIILGTTLSNYGVISFPGEGRINATELGGGLFSKIIFDTAGGYQFKVGGNIILQMNSQILFVDQIDCNAGVIDNTVIGGALAAAGTFTTLTCTSLVDSGVLTADSIVSTTSVTGATVVASTSVTTADLTVTGNILLGNAIGDTLSIACGTCALGSYLNLGSGLMLLDNDANLIGINTVSPGRALTVRAAGSPQLRLEYDGSYYADFQASASTLFMYTGTTKHSGEFLPVTDSGFNLGSSTFKWNNLYCNTATIASSLTAASGAISVLTSTTAILDSLTAVTASVANYPSSYPPTQNADWVRATTQDYHPKLGYQYRPFYATDPTKSLISAAATRSWHSSYPNVTNQRFHIDLGSEIVIDRIYYENYHDNGGYTTIGVKAFTFWGSNTSADFADLVYANDGTWNMLTVSTTGFDIHTSTALADPKYITVTNTTPYRFYAFKFADNWGSTSYMGVRRIELQSAGGSLYAHTLNVRHPLLFTPYFYASKDGVGIGTITPSYRLSVVHGDNALTGISFTNSTVGTAARAGLVVGSDSALLYLYTTSSGFTPSGISLANQGVLRSSPSASGGLMVGTGSTAPLKFFTSDDIQVTITSNGDVGIGTITPSATFHVEGSSFFTGNVGIGTAAPNNLIQVYDLIDFNNTDFNTKIGYQAGKNIISGARYNTYVGWKAGISNPVGGTNQADYNVGIGTQCLSNQTTGTLNVAVGYLALEDTTTGYQNVSIGSYSGMNKVLGNRNVMVGDNAGSFHADGSTPLSAAYYSVYIGAYSRGLNDSDSNSIVIGYQASGLGANTVVIGNDSVTTTALKGILRITGTPATSAGLVSGEVWSNGGVLTIVG